jgi:ABC-type oligopeptide transport system substrate-binding subunit
MTVQSTGFFVRGRFLLAILIAATIGASAAAAQDWHSTSSLMGESKYGDSFQRYDYVNPDAPKGGTLNSIATGTFDSLNPYHRAWHASSGACASSAAGCSTTR